jgi:hypothetical protein
MLYHYSENPNIKTFRPRIASSFPKLGPLVFAIDQEHVIHYYFPRDCPRVIYWKSENSSQEDIDALFSNTTVDKIMVVENDWFDRMQKTELFVYTFHAETFELFEEAKMAGYYISREEIAPVSVEPVGNLLSKILHEKVELRFTPNLYPIRNKVIVSTLDFSIIRLRNAKNE